MRILCARRLESLAYQTYDIARAMEQDSCIPIRELKVDGGAAPTISSCSSRATFSAAGSCARSASRRRRSARRISPGLAVGYWDSLEDVRRNWAEDKVFEPIMPADKRDGLLKGWHRAVKCALDWTKE